MSRSSSSHANSRPGVRLVYPLLSALVPGTGQIAAGYRRRGVIMLVVTITLVAGGIAVYIQDLSTLLSWLVQPRVLIGIFILNILVLLFRLGAIIDAYLATRPHGEPGTPGWKTALVTLALAVMLLVTAAPHALLGYYTYLTHDTLTTVFSPQGLADIEPNPTPTPEPTATPEPVSVSEDVSQSAPKTPYK